MIIFPKNKNGEPYLPVGPFASKTVAGKNIYSRLHGIKFDCVVGANNIDFTVPYPACKITALEFIGCNLGEIASVQVLDTEVGSYSGVPNKLLNQFAYDVNMTDGSYFYKSDYDADLYQGMKIRVIFTSLTVKSVGLNYVLHEVK